MYKVQFTKKAEKQFKQLERKIQERIGGSIERLKVRPQHFVKKLKKLPYFSLRVGNYRVVMEIVNKELLILVIEIGHRSKIYKKL